MHAHALRVIDGGPSNQDEADSPNVRRPTSDIRTSVTPRWWRQRVVLALRHSLFRPWLWPLQLTLIRLRHQSIKRALHTMRRELKFDGSVDFNFVEAFVDTEAERRHDPRFQAACENALRTGRLAHQGQPVILDEEIDGHGQNAFMYHFGWTEGAQRPDPLPLNMKP